ncbi:MAG: fibronectin type III domain-containing protein [Kiritimatiellae bacterium]|nr:fibronectin type III domain-containing protein [Kiritimatiellia bacterium]
MRKLFLRFAAAALLAPAVSLATETTTWTYTPTKDTAASAQTIDGVTITPAYTWIDENLTHFATSGGSVQIGKAGYAVSGITYTIPSGAFGKAISNIVLTAKAASDVANASDANKAKVSVSVGGTALSPASAGLGSTHADYVFSADSPLAGEIVVSITNPLAKNNQTSYALYIRSLTVTLMEDSSGPVTPPGGLVEAVLFNETFDNVAGTAWNTSGKISQADESDWTWGSNAIRGPKGIRLGTASNAGSATTREISVAISSASAPVSISFKAASYTGKTTAGVVTLIDTTAGDAETVILELAPAAMTNGGSEPLAGGTNYLTTIATPDKFKLRFESLSTASDKRLILDDILVTQVYDSSQTVLAAPTVSVSDIGENSFTVSWAEVPGATGYEVRLDGTITETCDSETTSATIANLSDDTAYAVQVRALGDGETVFLSVWSDTASVRTARSALHPALTLGSWENEVGDGALYAETANSAAVSVSLADGAEGSVAAIAIASVTPEQADGAAGPTLDSGIVSWTPAAADAGKTFALAFAISVAPVEGETRTWTETATVTAAALPAFAAPTNFVFDAETLAWNRADFTWSRPFRATRYTLRIWAGAPDPESSDSTWSEDFASYPDVKPAGWTFDNGDKAYTTYTLTRVAFKDSGSVTSPELGGSISSLSFVSCAINGSSSTLTLCGWNGSEWAPLASYTGETLPTDNQTNTVDNLSGAYSRFKWEFTKVSHNCGIGSVVVTGSGLPTAKVISREISPASRTAATMTPAAHGAVNYADITAYDADGNAATSAPIQFEVPEIPPSETTTLISFF